MECFGELLNLAKKQKYKLSRHSLADCVVDANGAVNIDEYNELKTALVLEGVEVLDSDVDLEFEESAHAPFDPKLLDIVHSKMTLGEIYKRIEGNGIDLASPFQRKAGIWDNERKSRLIESILINIPLPMFYVDATNDEKWLVIDGLQRLTAIKEFVIDGTMSLSNLEFLGNELNGCLFEGVGRKNQRRIEETEINICKLVLPTPAEVKYVVFKRFNTGGIKLEDQEIRNALFQGAAVDLLNEMAQIEVFTTTVGSSVNIIRMEDREFCLRYLAYVFFWNDADFNLEFVSDSSVFLNSVMSKLNSVLDNMDKEEYERIKRSFESDLKRASDLFDRYTFRRIGENFRRGPISKYLFQSWLLVMHELTEDEFAETLSKKEVLRELFKDFCISDEYKIMRSPDDTAARNKKMLELVSMTISNDFKTEEIC
ncbi:MAG: DUF262 domain-containing protein [Oscillospiraceae bacterium]|jgi:hypothetical protein|nr:DUF262 domain-containing protein [Oscillospiraceae bacterium]